MDPTLKTASPAPSPRQPPHENALASSPQSGPASRESSQAYYLAVAVLALAMLLFAVGGRWVPNKWLHRDGSFYDTILRGLLEHGSLRQEAMQPRSWYEQDLQWNQNLDPAWSNVAAGPGGQWWPKHPFLLPLAAAPLVWALGPIGSLVFQVLGCLLIALLAFRIASRFGSRPAALAASCALCVTPWFAERAWGFNNDVFYTVLVLGAIDGALALCPAQAGLLLGLAVFAKPTNALYGPAILFLFLARRQWRAALRMCLFAAGPVVVDLAANTYMFGSPLRTGYDRILHRAGGALALHSHAQDFDFAHLGLRLRQALFGPDGMVHAFPLFFAGLAGMVIFAFRRWREALALTWCLALPIVVHAPFRWYRMEFSLPQVALSVAGLAALLPPFAPPSAGEEPARFRLRWGALAAAGLALLLLVGLGRRVVSGKQDYLWEQLPSAKVTLGTVPCDYYNPQMERWECSHQDDDWRMTGRPLAPSLTFSGRQERMLLVAPHPSGKERRLEYPQTPVGKRLVLRVGFPDQARPDAQARLQVRLDDHLLFDEEVRGRGLSTRELDTSAFAGRRARLSFTVTSSQADGSWLTLNGSPRD